MASTSTPEAASSGHPAAANVPASKGDIYYGGSESYRQRALTPLEEKLKTAREDLEKLTGLDFHWPVSVGSAHSLALREKRQKSAASRRAARQNANAAVPSAAAANEDPRQKGSQPVRPGRSHGPDMEATASSLAQRMGRRSPRPAVPASRGAADFSPAREQSRKADAPNDEEGGEGPEKRSTSAAPEASRGPKVAEASVGRKLPPATAQSQPQMRVLPYHTAHRQLFNLSLLRTSTQHWERDKALFYTPISATSVSMPTTWPSSLRGGLMMYCTPTKPAPTPSTTLSMETLQQLLSSAVTKKQADERRRHKKLMRMKADGLWKPGEDEEVAMSTALGDFDEDGKEAESDADGASLMRRRVERLARQMGVGLEAVKHLIRLHDASKAEQAAAELADRLLAEGKPGAQAHAEGAGHLGDQPSAALAGVSETDPDEAYRGDDLMGTAPSTSQSCKERACRAFSLRTSMPPPRPATVPQHAADFKDVLATRGDERCASAQILGMKPAQQLSAMPALGSQLMAGLVPVSSQGINARGLSKLHVALPGELTPHLAPGAVRAGKNSVPPGEAKAGTRMASGLNLTDLADKRSKRILHMGFLEPKTPLPPALNDVRPCSMERSQVALQASGVSPPTGAFASRGNADSERKRMPGGQPQPAATSSFFDTNDSVVPTMPESNWKRALVKASEDLNKNRDLSEDCCSSARPSMRSRAAPLAANMLRQLQELGKEDVTFSQVRPDGIMPGSATGAPVPSGLAVKSRPQRRVASLSAPVRPLLALEASMSSKVKRILNDARQFGDNLELLEKDLLPVAHRMRG